MNFRHYSRLPIHALHDPIERHRVNPMKPHGFWISDESDCGWKEWCEDEDFRIEALAYEYGVAVKPDANVLHITGRTQLVLFTQLYTDASENGDLECVHYIDWKRLEKDYAGIIITPYQWDSRMCLECAWYYGWDCASGCIWDMDAIDSISLIRGLPDIVR